MHEAIEQADQQARATIVYQVHKSIGLSVLALSLLRLVLRLAHSSPAPVHSTRWQSRIAKLTHGLFYGLMMGIPLSGWLMVSTQWRDGAPLSVPTLWFGLFEVPHLFGVAAADTALRSRVYDMSIQAHAMLATATLLLLALHIGAALKHQFLDRDGLMLRMSPVPEKTAAAPRRWSLWGGLLLLLLAAAAITMQALAPPAAAPPDTTASDITSIDGSWRVVAADSNIAFQGSHAGTPFSGQFTRWQSNIHLSADNPANSQIVVTVFTDSATDGVKLHDETLPSKEWFNIEQYPTATYRSESVRRIDTDRYTITGLLTIKDRHIPVPALTLSMAASRARIDGSVVISRADADLGMTSDPGGRWVSSDITVDITAVLLAP